MHGEGGRLPLCHLGELFDRGALFVTFPNKNLAERFQAGQAITEGLNGLRRILPIGAIVTRPQQGGQLLRAAYRFRAVLAPVILQQMPRDAAHPRLERRLCVEGSQAAPGRDEGFLRYILGLREVAHAHGQKNEHAFAIQLNEALESTAVTLLRGQYKLGVQGSGGGWRHTHNCHESSEEHKNMCCKADWEQSKGNIRMTIASLPHWARTVLASHVFAGACIVGGQTAYAVEAPRFLSGIYPHLAMYNRESECGTGAVVPWAGRLWVITYAPHAPLGSSDKLYEITPALEQIVRPESVGGTPAGRLIHNESHQLFIGPYVIDANRRIRTISPFAMPGRLTGIARHLEDPAGKVYYATMEEGLYEVDVKSLDVTAFIRDGNRLKDANRVAPQLLAIESQLPGYHGKGLYSGQGRLIYANNGERSEAAKVNPTTPSGALAEWRAPGEDWSLVRRNQFTDVTGPGGIHGNAHPASDPVWTIGWDAKSLLLMVLDGGTWHSYRLPKGSHSYDGAHGWNTEWPRIRDIGEDKLLMTMHGMFWSFPRDFRAAKSDGIAPRSSYLKVIGDFARWENRIVFGCDDTARAEFLNKRKLKAEIKGAQSHSNLWFVEPAALDHFGPALGRGSVWLREDVAAGRASDPMLFSGFQRRGVHLAHEGAAPVTLRLEIDGPGSGAWQIWREVRLEADEYKWLDLTDAPRAAWIRVVSEGALKQATVAFHFSQPDHRTEHPDRIFAGLATMKSDRQLGGTVRASDDDTKRTLELAAREYSAGALQDRGLYQLDASMTLRPVNDARAAEEHLKNTPTTENVIQADTASVLVIDEAGRRWRLPRGSETVTPRGAFGPCRVAREVVTERDLMNAFGTFFELPAENAGGVAKIRPIATHDLGVVDYASYRGLLVLSGIEAEGGAENPHLIRSSDGRAALWAGAIDDLWRLGKPRGRGGPWKDTTVYAQQPSDPYLLTGYDAKRLTLSHRSDHSVSISVQIDIDGSGYWKTYRVFEVLPGGIVQHDFPEAFQGYWLRTVASEACTASAQLEYR